ncbi:MAG TPA: hypothetical protein VGK73_15095 [Polyangiaceae bacterium]
MSEPAKVAQLSDYRPHSTGHAECLGCGHRWVSVAPIGTVHLDCPKCERAQGIWTHGFEPKAGESMWTCRCGNALFYVQPGPVLRCRACGEQAIGYDA